MPFYREKKLLFIHIPKTGGTVIENAIKSTCKQELYSGYTNNILEYPYNQKSLQHQFYSTLYRYRHKLRVDFNNIKIFSVVRNPYDKVISDLFWFSKKIKVKRIQDFSTAEDVFDILKNNYFHRDDLDNHNKPQYQFVTDEKGGLIPNIKIYKCEELNKLNGEINKFIGIDIDIKKNDVNKDYSKYLNKDSNQLINKYYKKDFELFNYAYR
jgi:hypothetical protein